MAARSPHQLCIHLESDPILEIPPIALQILSASYRLASRSEGGYDFTPVGDSSARFIASTTCFWNRGPSLAREAKIYQTAEVS
jgi:hypothetical protein